MLQILIQKKLIPVNKATFIYGGALESPMEVTRLHFSDANKAKEYAQKIRCFIRKNQMRQNKEINDMHEH